MEAESVASESETSLIKDEPKQHMRWYRRILCSGFGTATLYLRKPVLPPLIEYQNLLVRRNPLDNVRNHPQDQNEARGVEAYLDRRNQNAENTASVSHNTGSEVKVLRRFRLFEGKENLRPCLIDFGLGGRIGLEPSVKIEPVARVRFAELATIKCLPKPAVKISKTLPFHWQGMQAHFRYEVPLESLKDSWWKPPARMLIRFEHGSNSGFHLYPGGFEFGDHSIPLTSDNTVALRLAAGLTFPREYPVRPGNGPQWDIYRLGIKTVW